MSFTLTFAWWWIPALVTAAGICWVASLEDSGNFPGLMKALALLPVMTVSAIAWAIAGALK